MEPMDEERHPSTHGHGAQSRPTGPEIRILSWKWGGRGVCGDITHKQSFPRAHPPRQLDEERESPGLQFASIAKLVKLERPGRNILGSPAPSSCLMSWGGISGADNVKSSAKLI